MGLAKQLPIIDNKVTRVKKCQYGLGNHPVLAISSNKLKFQFFPQDRSRLAECCQSYRFVIRIEKTVYRRTGSLKTMSEFTFREVLAFDRFEELK